MKVGAILVSLLRALGLLSAIWLVLAGVGFAAGVVPEFGADPASAGDAPETEGDDGPASEASGASPDQPGESSPSEPERSARPSSNNEPLPVAIPSPLSSGVRWSVCEGQFQHVAITVANLVGDERRETIVVCEREVHVLGQFDDAPVRVARMQYEGEGPAKPAAPLSVDLNGDGQLDLLLGFATIDAEGGPSGGTVALIPGDGRGGLREATLLAPIGAIALDVGPVDGEGVDLVAMHWADGFGRRPSEVWVFGGGVSPVRKARRRLSGEGIDLAICDLDLDGFQDVLVIESDIVTLLSGDGTGAFPRALPTSLPASRHVVRADVDSDGHDDLLVAGEGLHLWRAGQAEAEPVDAPSGIADIALADVDLNGHPDIVLLTREELVVMNGDGATFREGVRSPLPTARVVAMAIDDHRAALLLRGTDGIELAYLPLTRAGEIDEASQARPVPDSPLVVSVPLR